MGNIPKAIPDVLDTTNARFWEVDVLRGTAVVTMVLFHLAFDLDYFGVYNIDVHSGLWRYLGLATAITFVLLAGVSLSLSHARYRIKGFSQDKEKTRREKTKFAVRGLKIFSLGLAITLATYLFIGEGFVIFGILHMIGLSTILAYPFLSLGRRNFIIGSIIVLAGLYLWGRTFDFPWLIWLGMYPAGFYTLDYFPLFPWFGVILMGISLGDALYPDYRRSFHLPYLPGSELSAPARVLRFLGRSSLSIYLVHQPVLLAALYLIGAVSLSTLTQIQI